MMWEGRSWRERERKTWTRTGLRVQSRFMAPPHKRNQGFVRTPYKNASAVSTHQTCATAVRRWRPNTPVKASFGELQWERTLSLDHPPGTFV